MLSHAAGVGAPISDALVRLVMVLKVNSLSRGFSGIRRVVIDALIALINAEVFRKFHHCKASRVVTRRVVLFSRVT